MKRIRVIVRQILPRVAVESYYAYRESKVMELNRRMATEDVFTDIYSNNRWGGTSGSFFSGAGSHEATIVEPYLAGVKRELERIGAASLTVVDLGCGDFSVGRRIASQCGRYDVMLESTSSSPSSITTARSSAIPASRSYTPTWSRMTCRTVTFALCARCFSIYRTTRSLRYCQSSTDIGAHSSPNTTPPKLTCVGRTLTSRMVPASELVNDPASF